MVRVCAMAAAAPAQLTRRDACGIPASAANRRVRSPFAMAASSPPSSVTSVKRPSSRKAEKKRFTAPCPA
eukprot:scaffold192050_cov33-Tisochrysis_lutea.AAC.1